MSSSRSTTPCAPITDREDISPSRAFPFPQQVPFDAPSGAPKGAPSGAPPEVPWGPPAAASDPVTPLRSSGVCTDLSQSFSPLLMDFYHITMAYGYWRQGKHLQQCVFEAIFRRAPFQGCFTVLGGVSDAVTFLLGFKLNEEHVHFIRKQLPEAEEGFFQYLKTLSGKQLTVRAIKEGSLVFPKVPVLQTSGPLGLCQLVETPLLNILGFATLTATNAARHRLAAGWKKKLFEFGARRAQGPDGALTASRYTYLGSFDGTSNVLAAYRYGIPLAGTMAHAFVSAFATLEDVKETVSSLGPNFLKEVLASRDLVFNLWPGKNLLQMTKEGELAAFAAFAMTFPNNFLALVDTYNMLYSGLPNFLAVALAMYRRGGEPRGLRIDSGDLAYLSREARRQFRQCEEAFGFPFSSLLIVVSNDLTEAAITALNEEEHEADVFGIGTNVVTCQSQPALGVVYKLVELEGKPCMKLSEDVQKTSLPTAKAAYRLYNKDGIPCIDLIQSQTMPPPVVGRQLFCKDLFDDKKRCFVIPKRVEELLVLFVDKGNLVTPLSSIETARDRCIYQLKHFRADHLRLHAPTEYKVSTTEEYYRFFHELWNATAPVPTID